MASLPVLDSVELAAGRYEVPGLDGAWRGHVGEVVQGLNVAQVDADTWRGLHVGIVPGRAACVEMAVRDVAGSDYDCC